MVSARLLFAAASALAITLMACGGSSDGTSLTRGNAAPAGGSSSGGSSSGGSSSGSVPPQKDGGVTPSNDAGSGGDSATAAPDLCKPYVGRWLATVDPGAVATGTDTSALGGSIPFGGTIDFTFTHDEADVPNVLDFTGTATIQAAGQTITQPIVPAKSPTGDPKDSTCEAGVLHFLGEANVSGIGNVLFAVEGHLDTSVTPTVGQGTFTMKTKDDNGAALSGDGTLHMVRK